MYFLVLWTLRVFVGVAVVLSFFGLLPFNPLALLFSIVFLTIAGWVVNRVFAWAFEVPANVESYAISAYILALIIKPPTNTHDAGFLFWAIVLTLASKFIVAIGKKHIFNPVAFGVALTAIVLGDSANWWVGSRVMLPVVLIGGLLIVRKIRRFDMILSFLGAAIFSTSLFGILKGSDPITTLGKVFLDSPLVFFATVMLSEPLTTPPTREQRLYYGGLVGLLFAPQVHVGPIYSTPELALVVGNILSYALSPKMKLLLTLEEKIKLATDEWDFVFKPDEKLKFTPGQYMEWTIDPAKMDSRGNRRYFTLASSPTEEMVRMGVKFYDNSSSFKKTLLGMEPGHKIVASQLAGEFVLNVDPNRKYVFLAGGIGITPYRSIVKYLLDTNQKRDYVLMYADKTEAELVYRDVFEQAVSQLGAKNVYVLSDKKLVPQNWSGEVGHIDPEMIARSVPDFKDRYFYISGSHAMVVAMEKAVKQLGVPRKQIKTDFFPGFV